MSDLSTYTDYIFEHAETLFQKGKDEKGQCTVLAYSSALAERLLYVEDLMRELGMICEYDALGNLFGLKDGTQKNAKKIMITSHMDSVVNAGRYDGVLGVLLGLAYVKYLNEQNIAHRHPVEVCVFMGEESPGVTATFGSRSVTGHYSLEKIKEMPLAWETQTKVPQAINRFFCDYLKKPKTEFNSDTLAGAQLKKQNYKAALEAHIEQFLLLKDLAENNDGLPWTGVMRGVGGHLRHYLIFSQEKKSEVPESGDCIRVSFQGGGGHSGATPMDKKYRDDALVSAARWLLQNETAFEKNELFLRDIQIINPSATTIPARVELYLQFCGSSETAAYCEEICQQSSDKITADLCQATSGEILHTDSRQAFTAIVLGMEEAALDAKPSAEIRATVTEVERVGHGLKLRTDIRGADLAAMEKVFETVQSLPAVQKASVEKNLVSRQKPVLFDEKFTLHTTELLSQAFQGRVLKGRISVPGQDIGNVAGSGIASALLFVESGTGHHPDEYARPEAVTQTMEAVIRLMEAWDKEEGDG